MNKRTTVTRILMDHGYMFILRSIKYSHLVLLLDEMYVGTFVLNVAP